MDKHLIQSLTAVLREAGFRNVARQESSVSTTLTADRDDTKIVVHVNEGGIAAPELAVRHSLAPKDLQIMMKATMPGLHPPAEASAEDPLRGLRQGSGGGSTHAGATRQIEDEIAKQS